jgi:hypothetical protein
MMRVTIASPKKRRSLGVELVEGEQLLEQVSTCCDGVGTGPQGALTQIAARQDASV